MSSKGPVERQWVIYFKPYRLRLMEYFLVNVSYYETPYLSYTKSYLFFKFLEYINHNLKMTIYLGGLKFILRYRIPIRMNGFMLLTE